MRCEKCRQPLNAERIVNEKNNEIKKLKSILRQISRQSDLMEIDKVIKDNEHLFEVGGDQ